MYTIKAFTDGKEYLIYSPRLKSFYIGADAYFEIGDNVNGQAEFTIYPGHPYYSYVKKLTTDIIFYNNEQAEFYGRVLYDDEDLKGVKKVYVEGELAFLCDSIQRPAVYHDISVRRYLETIISLHNSQVEERKQFTVGRVSVEDNNDSLYRYSNYETTRETITDKLIKRLGGHLVVRHENGIRMLDYLSDADFYSNCTQQIRFGKNLLNFAKNIDASEIITCLIPLGGILDEPQIEGINERLTIKDVNGGVDYVTDDAAVAQYGKIYGTKVWDNVTVASNLIKKAREYLTTVQYERMVLEVSAIDLSLVDNDIEQFEIGHKIRCVSEVNSMDVWLPLAKKKIYICQFSKNMVVLGDDKEIASYISSNRQDTATIEEEIASIPTMSEIRKQALEDAKDLINGQKNNGYAIHEPNEFIVSDDLDYLKTAKNLWRWGLGGLAHYSNGYSGAIDGIALTMDGKINGEMLIAGSVCTESLSAKYRTSVETAIEETGSAAKKYAKDTIETSIENLEDRIRMSVSSVKETVMRKNFVQAGEQETLSLSKFSITGMVADIEEMEFLNMKCFEVSFNTTGTIYISQSLGELAEGNYIIYLMMGYSSGKNCPSDIRYGFSNSLTREFIYAYPADCWNALKKTVKITSAEKVIDIGIAGASGTVCYITNIRVLRDTQDLLDELRASIELNADNITSCVTKNNVGSYITQYYDNVLIAFNNSSKYVQLTSGAISIYNGTIDNTGLRSKFTSSGCHFYQDGYYVGSIGTSGWYEDDTHKGLLFNLTYDGKYMTWARQENVNGLFITVLTYSRAGSIGGEYEGLHLGCSFYAHHHTIDSATLTNSNLTNSFANGYSVVDGYDVPIITSITDEGNGKISWTKSTFRVRNGMITLVPPSAEAL